MKNLIYYKKIKQYIIASTQQESIVKEETKIRNFEGRRGSTSFGRNMRLEDNTQWEAKT